MKVEYPMLICRKVDWMSVHLWYSEPSYHRYIWFSLVDQLCNGYLRLIGRSPSTVVVLIQWYQSKHCLWLKPSVLFLLM